MTRTFLLTALILAVFALHQDFWNWNSTGLVFDILPVGLAYHAAYTVVAACLMTVLVRYAWPAEIDHFDSKRVTKEKSYDRK